MGFQLIGLQFHFYGFILGVAAVVGILLAEKLVQRNETAQPLAAAWFWRIIGAMFLGGVLGARLYHVWTDWGIYQNHLDLIWQIWNGGLSIIGAFIGGVIGIALVVFVSAHANQGKGAKSLPLQKTFLFLVDVGVLCLPISQAIGRIGNFLNQELYGLPTNLPWGIYIDSAHRVAGYEGFTRFHPLFAYEALGMLLCAGVLWDIESKHIWKLGSGRFVLAYLAWYGLFRSSLETLRIEKASLFGTAAGLNQVILFLVGMICAVTLLVKLFRSDTQARKLAKTGSLVLAIVLSASFLSACVAKPPSAQPLQTIVPRTALHQDLMTTADRQKRQLVFRRQATAAALPVNFEIVNTPASVEQGLSDRDEIGSDGMLFIFPSEAIEKFWMLRMKFDLDLVWLANNKIVGITADVPRPASPNIDPKQLKLYTSPAAVDMVLELPAGTAKTWQLQPGDALELPEFSDNIN